MGVQGAPYPVSAWAAWDPGVQTWVWNWRWHATPWSGGQPPWQAAKRRKRLGPLESFSIGICNITQWGPSLSEHPRQRFWPAVGSHDVLLLLEHRTRGAAARAAELAW